MKRILMVLCALLLLSTLSAQQNVLYENLQKIFVSGTIADKTDVVEKAAREPGAETLITDGLVFADTYAALLGNEKSMKDLAAASVMNADLCDSADTASLVMNIFQKYPDASVRQSCLNYMLKSKRAADRFVTPVETYARELLDEGVLEEELMLSCIAVLNKIHSNSSFRVFFDYASSGFVTDEILVKAREAMNSLSDVYRINMLSIISDSSVSKKFAALQMVLSNETNSDVLRAEAAETALSTSIIHVGDTFDASLTDLQMAALNELRRLSWTRAANLVANYFAVARNEFEAGLMPPSQFIEVIDAVQELSVVKAGGLFTDYLNTCNTNVENGLSCSVPVVLAVINSLGALGDKVSFDALLYVSYVPYPDEVVVASREALARLKW